MKTYEPEIVMKIWEVFPDSFNVTKKSKITRNVAGPWGIEEVETGEEETIILAECIASTATAYSHNGTDMNGAMKYIEGYRPAWIQRREIKNFLR